MPDHRYPAARSRGHGRRESTWALMPLRFFATAPAFAALAAVLMACGGGFAPAAPVTAAAVHLLAAGCLAIPLFGALLWFLPVMAGIAIAGGAPVARALHGLLCAGTLLLAAAIVAGHAGLFAGALAAMGAALLLLGWCTAGVWRRFPGDAGASLAAIRLALAALACEAIPGLLAVAGLGWPAGELESWRMPGWPALAAIGVAFEVVPAFFGTAPYPRWIAHGFAKALFVLLAVSKLPAAVAGPLPQVALALLGAGCVAFAFATLRLLRGPGRRALRELAHGTAAPGALR